METGKVEKSAEAHATPALRARAFVGWLLLALLVGSSPSALASDGTSVTVGSGSLFLAPPEVLDFVAVTLDGRAQTTEAPLGDFSATDARGTGEGWNVTVEATRFREWNGTGYVSGGKELPLGSLSMPVPAVGGAGTSSPPPLVTPGPYLIDGASVVIARAAEGGGMGTFLFTSGGSLILTVPASAYSGSYRSELSISLTSGP